VNAFLVPFDSEWHLVEIPLNEFSEGGSWDNDAWFDPIGQFDWSAIDRFEVVAEQKSLSGINLWFDKIEIVDPSIVSVKSEKIANNYILHQNYPNPFNPVTAIKYSLPSKVKNVMFKVYDILGREIATLVNEKQRPGSYEVTWDAGEQTSGIYFYQLQTGDFLETKKMILLK
jgi:hypothetical protein